MLDRTVAPDFIRSTRFDLIQPEKITLPNGVDTFFISGGQQDVIKIELVFNGGRWFEKVWGAANFTGNLLLKGTRQKQSSEIANIFDLYGAHVEINPGLDVISVSLYSLNKYLTPALALLHEVLTESIFPEKELEQARSIYLQNLKVNQEKTSFLASQQFRKQVFGDNHAYGKELEAADVNALTRETLVSHFEHCFGDVFILVSGKIEAAGKDLIINTFSRLPFNPIKSASFAAPVDQPVRLLVEKEGSMQSSVRIGKRFIGRTHPDYVDVLLLNHILGGYFGSRLMKNIREDKGLSYGIYSSIHALRNDSYVAIGADVNKENLDLTFDEIRKEFTRLRQEKIQEDELDTARNHFIGSLQAELSTPFAHADKIKNILLYQLPVSYYQTMIHRLDTIRAEDLMKAADQYFAAESFYEIAVG